MGLHARYMERLDDWANAVDTHISYDLRLAALVGTRFGRGLSRFWGFYTAFMYDFSQFSVARCFWVQGVLYNVSSCSPLAVAISADEIAVRFVRHTSGRRVDFNKR